MKQVIILSGWYQKPTDNWYPWLKTMLEKQKYQVTVPDLPTMHTDKPSLAKQLNFIIRNYQIDKNTTIIGHSLGALLALRIAEKNKLAKIILVAGWDFNDLTTEHQLFWPKPINHRAIVRNVKQTYCVHSDSDPYITACQAEEMSKRLNGKFILVTKAGHFTGKEGIKELPVLIKYI